MVYFKTKNPNLCILECKMFVYFKAIWCNLWAFGIIYGSLI
jgi:hypothetical protein